LVQVLLLVVLVDPTTLVMVLEHRASCSSFPCLVLELEPLVWWLEQPQVLLLVVS
jgi:hypothetical protein